MNLQPIALVLLLYSLYAATQRRAGAYPGTAAAALYFLVASFGPGLWDWSRIHSVAGLPWVLPGDPHGPGQAALLIASIGSALGAIAASSIAARAQPRTRPSPLTRRQTTLLLALSLVVLLAWILGQGPSLLERTVYLESDGIRFLLQATFLPGPFASLLVFFVVASRAPDGYSRAFAWVTLLAWYACVLSVGTRLAILYPIVAYIVLIGRWLRRSPVVAIGFTLLLLPLAILSATWSFSLSHFVRNVPHGLYQLPMLLTQDAPISTVAPATWTPMLMELTSSIAASSVITDMTVKHSPPPEIIIANANPLPAGLAGVDPAYYEVLYPYSWVPMSFVGEWYGAFGALAQLVLFFSLTVVWGLGSRLYRRAGLESGVVLVFLFSSIAVLTSIQYPSRMFWRLAIIAAALPALLPAFPIIRFLPGARRSAKAGSEKP